jgi:hypothetical protein
MTIKNVKFTDQGCKVNQVKAIVNNKVMATGAYQVKVMAIGKVISHEPNM